MSPDLDTTALINLIERIGDLKLLPRTGWLLAGVTDVESIADHTTGVSLIALFLAETINAAPDAHGLNAPLDMTLVLQLALIHDLAESVLTDLPKRASLQLGQNIKHEAEASILAELLQSMPRGPYYLDLWRSYGSGITPEARLIKDVDKLEMVAQALRYAARGHRNLHEFWEGHTWSYPLCRLLCETMLDRL